MTSTERSVDHDNVAALRIAVMRLSRRLRLESAGSDLSLSQLSALAVLEREERLTIGELAGLEQVRPPSMTRTVNCLEEDGFVRRVPSANDGRQVVVELTETARDVLAEHRRRRDAWLADRFVDLGAAEVALLARVAPLLDRLAGAPSERPLRDGQVSSR